jgi:hypothetical protein
MRRSHLLVFASFMVILMAPHFSYAAISGLNTAIFPTQCTCTGLAGSGSSYPSAPDFGCVLQVIQNLLNDVVGIATIIISVFISRAGLIFMTSPNNPGAKTKARAGLVNAVIGLMIVLAAYLLIDSVMKVIYNQNASFSNGTGTAQLGPWNAILSSPSTTDCLVVRQAPVTGVAGATVTANAAGGGSATASTGTSSGGSCAVQTSGACSTSNMGAFGSAASQASQICNAESHGNASILSGTDKLGDGTPYSVGIFQINLTANSVGGLSCPSAFSKQSCTVSSCGAGTGVTVTNASLYQQCVTAAEVPTTNAAAAYQIYQAGNKTGGSDSWDPWGTAASCNLRN